MPVAGDPTNTDIISITEAYAGLNITTATEQATVATELASVVTAASRFVDSIDGAVVMRPVTETVRNPSGSTIVLDTYPVSVTAVTEYSGGVATVLAAESSSVAGGFTFEASNGVLSRRSSWYATSFQGQTLEVTYTAGRYVNTAAVDPLYKEAAVEAVIHFWQARGANSGAATFGGEGAPFGGIPFSTDKLREKLTAMLKQSPSPSVA